MLEEHLIPMGENNIKNSKVWKFGDVLNVTQNDRSQIYSRHMKILFILQAIKL
jgi:plasmid rolling circle replication initiator protein Rep